MQRPYSLGHRGVRDLHPENTLIGFKCALETVGVDRIECDVHITKDKHVVVIHDETVNRTTNGTGYVCDLTLEELRKLDAGGGQQIPLLEELLDLLLQHPNKILHLELKGVCSHSQSVKLVQQKGLEKQVLFISFHLDMLLQVKQIDSSLQTGALFHRHIDLGEIIARAKSSRVDDVGVFWFSISGTEFVQAIKKEGFKLHCFNPDNEDDIRKCISLGVDGMGSNQPSLLVKILKSLV